MRQGQQNRRGRGRNRKPGGHHNPLTRSYESNGPDVKIRGTPAHIAEKYISLARDAQSSGDPVLAENYLQHAEHYNRIIMGVREQQLQQGGDMNGGMGRNRPYAPGAEPFDGSEDFDDDGEDDDNQPMQHGRGPDSQPQPRSFESQPRHDDRGHNDRGQHDRGHNDRGQHDRGQRGERQGRPHREPYGQPRQFDRPERNDRNERHDRSEQRERPERNDRPERVERPERPERVERMERHDRPERGEPVERIERNEAAERPQRLERPERPERVERDRPPRIAEPAVDQPAARAEPAPRRRERFADQSDQPEFLRRPVRRPRREPVDEAANGDAPAAGDANPVDKTTA